jgi:hypothetical protein
MDKYMETTLSSPPSSFSWPHLPLFFSSLPILLPDFLFLPSICHAPGKFSTDSSTERETEKKGGRRREAEEEEEKEEQEGEKRRKKEVKRKKEEGKGKNQ